MWQRLGFVPQRLTLEPRNISPDPDALEAQRNMLRFCLPLSVFTQIYSISLLLLVTLGIAVAFPDKPWKNSLDKHTKQLFINAYQPTAEEVSSVPVTVNEGRRSEQWKWTEPDRRFWRWPSAEWCSLAHYCQASLSRCQNKVPPLLLSCQRPRTHLDMRRGESAYLIGHGDWTVISVMGLSSERLRVSRWGDSAEVTLVLASQTPQIDALCLSRVWTLWRDKSWSPRRPRGCSVL